MHKDTLGLAVGVTYDLVLSTGITAHPARAPYPKVIPDYVVPIKKGGNLEYLFSATILEFKPDDIVTFREKINDADFMALIDYVQQRKASFGFKDNGIYRFYVLKHCRQIPGSQCCKGIQVSILLDSDQLLNGEKK